MKFLSCFIGAVLSIMMIIPTTVQAADAVMPKREMRSAWVATVWQLDWPKSRIKETGNVSQINQQKKDMITLLDSMAVNNMNAINFQVRSRSDAFYKSSFEPWSSDLVTTRGMDPGYDPLEFVVEECHKRGLECHAWVNPYRYESVAGAWGDGAGEYRKDHPDWLIDQGGASILNPGKKEVQKRIVDICREIITKYDVDGILYDDYFYISGTPDSADADLYEAYKTAGGKLSQDDWRRDNVNRMIKAVHDMIQEVKPWVRFGVSPAGVAATSTSVSNKYGVEPCPSGSDWQYNDIYSDPLAWISQRSLDFISPQVYWTIGYSKADYAKITPWWAKVANKFGRHFYTSHSISSLTASSKEAMRTTGTSALERRLMAQIKASGPNSTTFKEYADEIRLNRKCTLNDAPGSIFYSCKYMYSVAPLFAHYLKTTVFSKPAIMPAMTYKAGYAPGNVKSLLRSGNTLNWGGYENVKYTIYAVPNSVSQTSFNCESKYLLGTSYATSYNIPEAYRSGYQYAVCVLDRYSNEYTPIFAGTPDQTLVAATLVSPTVGSKVIDPFDFVWNASSGATSYIVEVALDAQFTKLIATLPTTDTKVSSASIENMKGNVAHYWRVRSCARNYQDGVSSSVKFTPQVLSITSPLDNASGVSTTSTFEWTSVDNKPAILEIATDRNFVEGSVIVNIESKTGSYKIPSYTLEGYTTYYARLTMQNGESSKTTDPITFTTEALIAEIPVITYPKDGANLYSEDMVTLERQLGANSFTVEIADNEIFPRARYIATLKDFQYQTPKASEIKISGKNLINGTTYYLHALATYKTPESPVKTSFCKTITFVYAGQGSGVEDNIAGASVKIIGGIEPMLVIVAPTSATVTAQAVSSIGIVEETMFEGLSEGTIELPLNTLSSGMHLIVVKINGTIKTFKFIK
ncbi:MAG: family 10 glycosylhydrolase [Muribaculaceae bacterium]